MLVPKLFTTLRDYNRSQFASDLTAGVIVGIVALPLAIAFAIASGVSPERGLITAIVAGFLISFLGGTRTSIGGPTGAFVVIIYAIAMEHGYAGLCIATVMAGLILIVMGLARLGGIIKFIPFPVTTGFTAGIAVIIFAGQLNFLFGLVGLPRHGHFHLDLLETLRNLAGLNPYAVATALVAFAGILASPRITRKVPGSLVGMIGAAIVVALLDWPVRTIGSEFGGIPR